MQKFKRLTAGFLSAVMALSLLALPNSPLVASSYAITQDEINALKENQTQLQTQKQQLQSQLSALSNDEADAMARVALVAQQMALVQAQLDGVNQQISDYDDEIAETTVELEETGQEKDAYYELFCDRVRSMEEGGAISYWSVLFSAASFGDLVQRMTMIEEIMEYDNGVIEKLEELIQTIEDKKADLEAQRAEQEAARAEVEAYQAELQEKTDEVTAILTAIQNQKSSVRSQYNSVSSQAREIASKITKGETQLAAQLAAAAAASSGSSSSAAAATTTETATASGSAIVATAKQYLGCKYVWAATGPKSFDCSGFTMYVFAKHGISLPHHSGSQYQCGTKVSKSNLQPGDLVFFGSSSITHVGIYIGSGQFIHASTNGYKVRISSLSESAYSRKYWGAVRVL